MIGTDYRKRYCLAVDYLGEVQFYPGGHIKPHGTECFLCRIFYFFVDTNLQCCIHDMKYTFFAAFLSIHCNDTIKLVTLVVLTVESAV